MRHRHWHGWARPLAVLAFCLAAGIGVAAQSGSGTLVGTVKTSETSPEALAELMVGRKVLLEVEKH